MDAPVSQAATSETRATVIQWLLDSDPAIRWQVMRDLLHEPADVVAAERARIATIGWGARLLALQADDGLWGGSPYGCPGWIYTTDSLLLLRDLGLDPAGPQARRALGLIRDHVNWGPDFGNSPYFDGETEACINGRVLVCGAYFGAASESLVARLLREQLADGGWNCFAPPSTRSSFHSTICVLEGLLEYETANGATAAVTAARRRGEDYLLARHLYKSLSTGAMIKPAWTALAFPNRWHYDILWGLDYLRRADVAPDVRIAEAIHLVRQKRDRDGRWPLEHTHAGEVHFDLEGGVGTPSRWITLRAMRVLDWYSESGRG